MVQEEEVSEDLSKLEGIATSDGAVFFEKQFLGVHHEVPDSQDAVYVGTEELEHWDMFLPLSSGDPGEVPKAMIASCDGVPRLHKTEVVYTKGIEGLLGALQSPLTVVHNVDPTEAAACFEKWVAPVQKELRSFDSAAVKIQSTDRQVREDLRTGKAKVVPMKVVYTVKPPSEQAAADGELFRRKARVVACGNMMAESGEETYAGTAPAEVVRSSLSISSLRGWDAATLDVTAAFLQTPLKEVQCQQRILGQPPRALVRAGLCGEHELWEFTHAVYGLRESPRWWGEFRDHQLAQLNVVLGTRKIKLLQCGVEGGWWRLVEGDALVGIVVVYVDDLLICSIPSIIMAVSDAVRALWETSALSWASQGGVRFLGIEITKVDEGFALNQEPYIQELLRVHSIGPNQKDLIPVSKDQASFEAEPDELIFTAQELKLAQQLAGEVLWLSQRTRPDVAYTASLVSSLCARAPRRATMVARKCLGYLQRTADLQLYVCTGVQEIVGWTDASFAPDGGRSHTGWIIMLGSAPISWRSSRQPTVTLSTAESELGASVEGALALASTEALLEELNLGTWKAFLRTDSTSSLQIQRGSGSWRTRHLRIKARWIAEKLESGELCIQHCPGEFQVADALTKTLSSARLRTLSRAMGLKQWSEIPTRNNASNDSSSSASAPNSQGFKILVALMVLSQAVCGCKASDLTVYEPMAVDRGLLVWYVFAVVALIWTAVWELLKFLGWRLYFNAVPGASSRRLRRLQRIRDTTAEAIRCEIENRRRTESEGGLSEARRAPTQGSRDDRLGSTMRTSTSTRTASGSSSPEPIRYRSDQRDRAVQTTGPSFAPPIPEIRTEIRRELQIPDHVHIVPGNQCFHIYNPCYAFRHRGTQGRVQTLRLCEYCHRHQGQNPQARGRTIDELLRAGLTPAYDRPGVDLG